MMAALKAASGVASAALVAAALSGSGGDEPPALWREPQPPVAFIAVPDDPAPDFAARWPRGLALAATPPAPDVLPPVPVYAAAPVADMVQRARATPRAHMPRRDRVCKHGRSYFYKDRHRYWRCKH